MAVNAFSNPQFSVDATGSINPSLTGANALTPKKAVQAKTKTTKNIFRYPVKQLEGSTDYLEIKVVKYIAPGFNSKSTENLNLRTSTEVLQPSLKKPKFYIHLPIPSGISDSNSVDWGNGDAINTIEAYGVNAVGNVMASRNAVQAIATELQKLPGVAQQLSVAGAQDLVQSFFAGKLINSLGANVTTEGILSRSTGQVLNPNLELLFNAVNLRRFDFAFDFAPRDPNESKEVKDIIRIFKRSMAAKTTVGGEGAQAIGAGLFISAPDVFQLTFKTGSSNHPFLYKMKPCALTNMGVDYAASGPYATYGDSTPVHMRMTLQFTELNPVYAEDYNGVEGVGY